MENLKILNYLLYLLKLDQFVLTVLEVLDVDAKESSNSVSFECNSPEEIALQFNDITYSKVK
jgi:hypothetical protein